MPTSLINSEMKYRFLLLQWRLIYLILRLFEFLTWFLAHLRNFLLFFLLMNLRVTLTAKNSNVFSLTPINKVVLDILPKRYEHYLSDYFNLFDKSEHEEVRYLVSDIVP